MNIQYWLFNCDSNSIAASEKIMTSMTIMSSQKSMYQQAKNKKQYIKPQVKTRIKTLWQKGIN